MKPQNVHGYGQKFDLKIVLAIIVWIIAWTITPLSLATAHASDSKPTVLKALKEWQGRLIADDEKASKAQKEIIKELASGDTLARADRTSEPNLFLATKLGSIDQLDFDRLETQARRRIVDQLTFAIDTKWSGADLKSFLIGVMLDLAITDLADPGQGSWWKFLIQSAIALKETSEPGADPIRFIEAYMDESSVLEPKSPLDVVKSRKYIGR